MIDIDITGPVAVVRMVRGKGNALDVGLLNALLEALDRLERHPARAAIITGQGSVFGAGVDLAALLEGGAPYTRKFLPLLTRMFERLATFPKPMVAAVNGHAIAGGAIIMLACDVRLLARGNARIGLSEIRVGVQFPAWGLEIARFATPPQHFPTLICGGHTNLPDEALARGLVDELVDADQLIDRALGVAGDLAKIPRPLFAATKLAVRRPMIVQATTQAALTDDAVIEDWCCEDTRRQIAAFFEANVQRKT
jgi:enoyl-CoA hydratase